jgi:hypothetical protein
MSPGPKEPLGDVRWYFRASVASLALMVASMVGMSAVGMPEKQSTPVMVAIGGFATLILSQYRTAYQQARSADELRSTLAQTSSRQEFTTEANGRKLAEIAGLAKATHAMVHDNMSTQFALNQKVTRKLADITRDPEDVRVADLAAARCREHESMLRGLSARDGGPE